MTPQQELQLKARARLRIKKQRILATGESMRRVPDERIQGAFDAAAQPEANQSITTPERRYGFTDNMLASLPFGDEVGALGGAIGRYAAGKTGLAPEKSFGESYQQSRALERAAQEEYQAENPGGNIGGKVLGIAAAGPARLTAAGPQIISSARTLPGAMRDAAIGGGVISGAYGAGEGEGAVDRLKGGAKGAAIGATVGAVIPPAVAGTVGAVRRVLGPATGTIANRAAPEARATQIVERALRRDNVTPAQAANRLAGQQAVNPNVVLADVAGANTRALTRTAVNTPGAGRERVTDFVMERNLRQPERIVGAVTQVLRSPADFGRTVSRMAAERENIASPLYDQAFRTAQPVDTRAVVRFIDSQVTPGVNQVVNPLADLRPDGITATLGRLRAFFATPQNQRVSLEALHRVKMELDDLISSSMRSGDTTKARAVLGVQNRLLQAMDRASPTYHRAREIYSSTHGMERALEVGRGIFNMTADDVTAALADMTAGEREMVQVGLARAIQDQVESRGFGSDVLRTVFKNRKIMDALRAAFQNDQAFRRFQGTLHREAQMRRTADAVTGNSTTARQVADLIETQNSGAGRDVLSLLLEGRPVRALATTVRQAIFGEQGLNERVANRIADMLLSNDPQVIQSALRALSRRQGAVDRLARRLRSIGTFATNEAAGESGRNVPALQATP